MLREIDSGELGKLFSRGMDITMDKAAFSKVVPGVLRMSQDLLGAQEAAGGRSVHGGLDSRHRHGHHGVRGQQQAIRSRTRSSSTR